MDLRVLVAFIYVGFGLITCSHPLSMLNQYRYVNQPMTWTDAQRYCREKYIDLVTFESMDDINKLNRPDGETSPAWIGLNNDPQIWSFVAGSDAISWRWSASGSTKTIGYSNWRTGEPDDYYGDRHCAEMQGGTWVDQECATKRYFVCHDDKPTGERTYTSYSWALNWISAQRHCRAKHTDLAMIENEQQLQEVSSLISAYTVWIGLHQVPWMWSDGSTSSFRNWGEQNPDNYNGDQFCVAENLDHTWNDLPCTSKYPFWCHATLEHKIILRMKFQSDADLSDDGIHGQILQQLTEKLRRAGVTDVKLTWKIPPKKLEEEEDEPETKHHQHNDM